MGLGIGFCGISQWNFEVGLLNQLSQVGLTGHRILLRELLESIRCTGVALW